MHWSTHLPTVVSHCSLTGGCKDHYRKKGVLVAAELQVCIALLVVLDVHGFHVGVGQQASLHGSEASVGLCHVNARDGDAVTRLHCPRDLAPELNVNATGGSSMRHLGAINPRCTVLSLLVAFVGMSAMCIRNTACA